MSSCTSPCQPSIPAHVYTTHSIEGSQCVSLTCVSYLKPSCSRFYSMSLQHLYRECIGHRLDVVDLLPGDCCAHAATEFKAKLLAHLGHCTTESLSLAPRYLYHFHPEVWHDRKGSDYARLPNEHARLIFQHAMRLHDILDSSQPGLAPAGPRWPG